MNTPDRADVWVVSQPHWGTIFVLLAAVLSVAPFLVGFLLGLSVGSDVVFGFYALISGVAADWLLRSRWNRHLLIWRQPKVSFLAFWVLLCLYVMIAQPLGG